MKPAGKSIVKIQMALWSLYSILCNASMGGTHVPLELKGLWIGHILLGSNMPMTICGMR